MQNIRNPSLQSTEKTFPYCQIKLWKAIETFISEFSYLKTKFSVETFFLMWVQFTRNLFSPRPDRLFLLLPRKFLPSCSISILSKHWRLYFFFFIIIFPFWHELLPKQWNKYSQKKQNSFSFLCTVVLQLVCFFGLSQFCFCYPKSK